MSKSINVPDSTRSREKAYISARRVEEYWRYRGYLVKTSVLFENVFGRRDGVKPARNSRDEDVRHALWCVRSDMIGGVPREKIKSS